MFMHPKKIYTRVEVAVGADERADLTTEATGVDGESRNLNRKTESYVSHMQDEKYSSVLAKICANLEQVAAMKMVLNSRRSLWIKHV